jgi:hypothetical protein
VTVQVGNTVPGGGGFSIQVSTSSPIGIVPNVLEVPVNLAPKIITDAGFIPKFSTKSPDSARLMVVSSQSPTGGSIEPLDSAVTLVASDEVIE